ncbi:MAG: hypothetical protein MJ065_03605 [Oscillospiraceae bacterium]|nr:hypothetical protein [Oscillospiraceae bacterium]
MKPILKAPGVRRITSNLTPEDQAEIDAALIPELTAINPEVLRQFQEDAQLSRKSALQAAVVFLAALIVGIFLHAYNWCITVGMVELIILYLAVTMNYRLRVDENASMMTLPVHHSKSTLLGVYAVCYLPDGEYCIRYDRKQNTPVSIHVIRWEANDFCVPDYTDTYEMIIPAEKTPNDKADTE